MWLVRSNRFTFSAIYNSSFLTHISYTQLTKSDFTVLKFEQKTYIFLNFSCKSSCIFSKTCYNVFVKIFRRYHNHGL